MRCRLPGRQGSIEALHAFGLYETGQTSTWLDNCLLNFTKVSEAKYLYRELCNQVLVVKLLLYPRRGNTVFVPASLLIVQGKKLLEVLPVNHLARIWTG